MLEKKLHILNEIFGDYSSVNQRNGKEYLFYCPKCKHHKKKLSFNIEKNFFKCWVCLWSSKSIHWAIVQFGNNSQIAHWNELSGNIDFASLKDEENKEIENIYLPEEYISLANHKLSPLTLPARLYLKERGITFQDIVWWKMGVCLEGKYKDRIIIPSFDMNGRVNYFVARAFTGHPVPYLNPPLSKDVLFNELFIDWNKDIVLTEGVFDAVVPGNSIPLLGSTLREDTYVFQTIVSKCSKVFIALDPDAEYKEKEITKQFLMYGVKVFKIRIKPYGDLGSMPRHIYVERKSKAYEITPINDIEMALME